MELTLVQVMPGVVGIVAKTGDTSEIYDPNRLANELNYEASGAENAISVAIQLLRGLNQIIELLPDAKLVTLYDTEAEVA